MYESTESTITDECSGEQINHDECSQLETVGHNGTIALLGDGANTPPCRPPALVWRDAPGLQQDDQSDCNSLGKDKDISFKEKFKDVKNGTAKVTKEMYSRMSKAIKKSLSKYKERRKLMLSPVSQNDTFSLDEEKQCEDKKMSTLPLTQSPKNVFCSPKTDVVTHHEFVKESLKAINCITINELITGKSILSSYPIISMIENFIKDTPNEDSEENLNELFQHWTSTFVETCLKQIKSVILTTNNRLSHYIDVNSSVLISGRESFIKVHTIPTWTQVRILLGPADQKYIALKKSHCLSWFVLPRECPKLSQRWVIYPMTAMNTFENELRMSEENSIQWLLLRMVILKCFNKIFKDDVVPINLDPNNILLVSSTCGLIVVFKEGPHDLLVDSFPILKSQHLSDVPKQFSLIKIDIRETVQKFFCRLNIVSVLITSVWPLDYMAYMLANLMMDSDN